jgi:hypothetical protein
LQRMQKAVLSSISAANKTWIVIETGLIPEERDKLK